MDKFDESEYIRINKSLARREEMERLGPGFHSKHKVHKPKNVYTRKEKHKGKNNYQCAFLFYGIFCFYKKNTYLC